MAARAELDPLAVRSAVAAVLAALEEGEPPERDDLALAVRGTLRALEQRAPGRHLEVRVPPYAAVQCLPGPRHTRGTPPAVVETDPLTWMLLATGRLPFASAVADGRVRASGERADLDGQLPVPLS